MKEVNRKYNNLQKLCIKIDSKNEWVISLQQTTVEVFLFTIKKKILEGPCTTESLYNSILEISKIKDADIIEEDKKLIHRYIEYFYKISNAIV